MASGHPTPASIPARGTITPLRLPANPQAGLSSAASGALLSAIGLGGAAAPAAPAHAARRPTPHSASNVASAAAGAVASAPAQQPLTAGAQTPSAPLTVSVIDYNDGNVFVPGFDEFATPGGAVDLRAQVTDSATGTYTYSWNYSGLADGTGFSGGSTYDLTFHWNTTITLATTESVTLTVTDPTHNVVTETYSFEVPAGTGTTTGGTTWSNQELPPNLVSAEAPAIASQNVSVVADTGALETSVDLPSYNPNVSPIELDYDSLAANPMPIVVAEHQLDPTKSEPSQVEAQVTFDGTAGTAYYYNTSSLQPGDIQQIALQANASTLSTGRYAYTVNIYDLRSGVPTTFTYNDTATVINESTDPTFSAIGDGWTVSGLYKIIPASGGVILDEGDGASLWFTGSFGSGGGTFTSPAGDFSTLVENSGGSYTRTLTDGTVEDFSSGGYETATIDRNGLAVTYTYNGSHQLTQIEDPFGELTTLTYSGGYLQSIKDPANRLTTFTHSGGAIASVTYPDGNTWNYGYDSSGRMTKVTEPSSTGEPTKTTTIVYDSAERVSTITRPDGSNQNFLSDQEQGWTNSGTSSNPAPAVLLANASTVYTDPLGNVTNYRPDWRGWG